MELSVVSLSKVPSSWLSWQRQNLSVLTIVTRATFALRPGDAALAPEQEPPATHERPFPGASSQGLYGPCNLVPMKPRADVVLVGQAFAPRDQKVRSLMVRLAVGAIDKRVEVFCDRQLGPAGNLREGPPFGAMPLVYERAAGGPGTSNPLGVRADVRDAHGYGTLPNLQPPGLAITKPGDVVPFTGFGPIASTWPTRRALLGPNASALPAEWAGQVVPSDLDPSFFQTAPLDQQLPTLADDERIVLENLNVDYPELVTRLPGLRPFVFIEGRGALPESLAMRADTLWIESSRAICTVTWRGQVILDQAPKSLRANVLMAPSSRGLTWEEFEKERARLQQGSAGLLSSADVSGTLPIQSRKAQGTPLPFAGAPGAPLARAAAPATALPFRSDSGVALPLAPAPSPDLNVGGETLGMFGAAERSALAAALGRVPAPQVPAVPVTAGYVPGPRAMIEPVDEPAPAPALEPLHLLHFEPDALSGLRKDTRFAHILEAIEEREPDDELDASELDPDVADIEERREVFEVLARGLPTVHSTLIPTLADATRPDGGLVQPRALVLGELAFPFDELETLRATLAACAPHAGEDAEAQALLALVKRFLTAAGQPCAPAVAEGLAKRLREVFEKRALTAPGFLDGQVERALLENRRYQRRRLFGGSHVRAFLDGSMPVYLGAALASKLPLAQRVRARMLVEVHPGIDQNEGHPLALRALALGIVPSTLARR